MLDSLRGTGQLPKFEEDLFSVPRKKVEVSQAVVERAAEGEVFQRGQKDELFKVGTENWYLIPTAEVPVTNLVRDLIPRLTAAGAQGILEYELKKMV